MKDKERAVTDHADHASADSFLSDLSRRDHWHYAVSCEKPFCGMSFVLTVGVRHHCRGCGLSLCADHAVRHTINPFTHQPNSHQASQPFWLCGMCDLRLKAKTAQFVREQQQQFAKAAGDSDGESSVADSVCYSVFDNDALNTSKEEGR